MIKTVWTCDFEDSLIKRNQEDIAKTIDEIEKLEKTIAVKKLIMLGLIKQNRELKGRE